MTLQQLRYLIAVADAGSINSVAKSHFISQSTLSTSIKSLEEEMGVTAFIRTSRGIELTADGVELVAYARQVVEQAELMEQHFSRSDSKERERLLVSSQHYAFVVRAFISFVSERRAAGKSIADYTLRETRTLNVIDDVRNFRCDVGILFLSTYNERVLRSKLDEGKLRFSSLFRARPHIFVREGHPLARKGRVSAQDLSKYVRYGFEQGPSASLFFSEEPLASLPCTDRITVSDRATMTSLLRSYDGYLVSTGVRSDEMLDGIVAVPVDVDEVMNVGYITSKERKLGPLAQGYLATLERVVYDMRDENELVPSKEVVRSCKDSDEQKSKHSGEAGSIQ
ncbi:MAG: LysR family transcriptional regulator [Tractidigestivibacter sp.]|jgi:DNA-binding transcriptional LysR family regulator|uniref:LysR family transcriptional regulator n=1 Tax=Tractidigestivibacter sp. TaxID=2847320 RepID=UPI003D931514